MANNTYTFTLTNGIIGSDPDYTYLTILSSDNNDYDIAFEAASFSGTVIANVLTTIFPGFVSAVVSFTDNLDGTADASITVEIADSATIYPIGIGTIDTGGEARFTAEGTAACHTICEECYGQVAAACMDDYTFVTGLTPATFYSIKITDSNDMAYHQIVLSDAAGDITIDATDASFPIGFFTPEHGVVTVTIYEDSSFFIPVDFTSGTTVYGCIQLTFQYITNMTG